MLTQQKYFTVKVNKDEILHPLILTYALAYSILVPFSSALN